MNKITICLIVVVVALVLVIIIHIVNCMVNMKPMYGTISKLPSSHSGVLRICMFMVVTPEIRDYAASSIQLNKSYCELHNYDFVVIDENLTPDLPINFCKIQAAINLMKDQRYDYIIHVDADAVIIPDNHSYDVSNIIHRYFNTGLCTAFIAGEDCYDKSICSKPGRMNSGVFIVKNNHWGRKIMNKWLNSARGKCKSYTNQFPNCQLVFTNCVQFSELMGFIRIVPYNVLNGRDGLFIKHLMQETNRNRTDYFKKLLSSERVPVFS